MSRGAPRQVRGAGATGPSPLLVGVLIAAATFLAYLPTLRCGYVWDDDQLVTANRPVLSDDGFRDIWLRPSSTEQYYPAVFTSFWLERKLWGIQPVTLLMLQVAGWRIGIQVAGEMAPGTAVPGCLQSAVLCPVGEQRIDRQDLALAHTVGVGQ